MEIDQNDVSITIVCPPTVATNMRNKSEQTNSKKNENLAERLQNEKDTLAVEECVSGIIEAADRKARKV